MATGLERETEEAATPRANEDSLSDAIFGPPPDRPRSKGPGVEVRGFEGRRREKAASQGWAKRCLNPKKCSGSFFRQRNVRHH